MPHLSCLFLTECQVLFSYLFRKSTPVAGEEPWLFGTQGSWWMTLRPLGCSLQLGPCDARFLPWKIPVAGFNKGGCWATRHLSGVSHYLKAHRMWFTMQMLTKYPLRTNQKKANHGKERGVSKGFARTLTPICSVKSETKSFAKQG